MGYDEERGAEAEAAVLGSMLIEKQAIAKACLILKAEDFKAPANQAVFRAVEALYERDMDADLVTVSEEAIAQGTMDVIGGKGYLANLCDAVTTAAHVGAYAKLVKNASLSRKIRGQFKTAYESQSMDDIASLGDLIMAREGNLSATLTDFREDLPAIIDEILRTDVPQINTGFTRLDALLCGLEPGELVTVGARTSGGKTAFKTRMALNMAMDGHEVLYITSEMRVKELVKRILPQAVRIPSWKFRSRKLTEIERERVRTEGVDILSTLPIKMLARGRIGIDDIRRAVVQSGCKVVFVDYLQRCKFPKAERESSAIYEFMAEFKEILLNTQTVGVISSQLDRARDKEPERRPVLADFRGSAGIESESDVAILLWKPPVDPDKMDYVPPPPGQVRIEAVIGKGRNGVADVGVDMDFNGEYVRFAESSLNRSQEERWS